MEKKNEKRKQEWKKNKKEKYIMKEGEKRKKDEVSVLLEV